MRKESILEMAHGMEMAVTMTKRMAGHQRGAREVAHLPTLDAASYRLISDGHMVRRHDKKRENDNGKP